MTWRVVHRLLVAALVVTAAGCSGGDRPRSGADEPRSGAEVTAGARTMAALGDSITRGFAACGRGGDCVESSWATGTAGDLDSHWQRLGGTGGGNANVAVSGARVSGLAAQVGAAVRLRPDYVTVLIGANDACARTEAGMTPVDAFTRAFDTSLDALVRDLPDARILVLSIPDLARLWQVGRDRPDVRRSWQATGVCGAMLADPADTGAQAQARRDRVRERVRAYNAAMAAACGRHPGRCRTDGNAVFDHRFEIDDVSTVDFFHPSKRGQASLARITWAAGS